MEEEGTEDNGLEEDSRDGQVRGVTMETVAGVLSPGPPGHGHLLFLFPGGHGSKFRELAEC